MLSHPERKSGLSSDTRSRSISSTSSTLDSGGRTGDLKLSPSRSRQSTSDSSTTENGNEEEEIEKGGILGNVKMMASPRMAIDKVKGVSGWIVGKVWRK